MLLAMEPLGLENAQDQLWNELNTRKLELLFGQGREVQSLLILKNHMIQLEAKKIRSSFKIGKKVK